MRMLARNAGVVETAVGVGEQKERGGGGRCLGFGVSGGLYEAARATGRLQGTRADAANED